MSKPIAVGARIRKSTFEEGDAHPIGAGGTVIARLEVPEEVVREFNQEPPGWFYFVEWDDAPGIPIGVNWYKIEREAEDVR